MASREGPSDAEAASVGEPVLVSACLLGRACRYDGSHNRDSLLERELEGRGLRAVAFCPEEAGGLGTPRPPAWIEAGAAGAVLDGEVRVVTEEGRDVTEGFLAGARGALGTCSVNGIRRAFLKERSPSCGVRSTHVGGKLVEGPGVTAELLRRNGIEVEGVEGRRGSQRGAPRELRPSAAGEPGGGAAESRATGGSPPPRACSPPWEPEGG